jgi:hypothetical protein
MNIRDRPEATPIQEGAQVTSTACADYFYFRRGRQIVHVRIPKDDPNRPIEVDSRIITNDDFLVALGIAYTDEDNKFLEAGVKTGTFALLKASPSTDVCRVLVTVGNESRPFDLSGELIRELGIKL